MAHSSHASLTTYFICPSLLVILALYKFIGDRVQFWKPTKSVTLDFFFFEKMSNFGWKHISQKTGTVFPAFPAQPTQEDYYSGPGVPLSRISLLAHFLQVRITATTWILSKTWRKKRAIVRPNFQKNEWNTCSQEFELPFFTYTRWHWHVWSNWRPQLSDDY